MKALVNEFTFCTDFPWSGKLDSLRDNVFRISSYRPLQRQVMNATLSGRDCILIMPTGGGKSLCLCLMVDIIGSLIISAAIIDLQY